MKVLVAFASKYGSTKGIAEFIGEKLRQRGIEAEVIEVGVVKNAGVYDAFVIGSAVYQFHWLKEAKKFVSQNRSFLASKPVWLFSSGPTGPKATDSKGRDLREVSGPKELGELRESINPRDHRVFFGALFRDRLTGAAGLFARWIPKEGEGDFRNWKEIEAWAVSIAEVLQGTSETSVRALSGHRVLPSAMIVAATGEPNEWLIMPESRARKQWEEQSSVQFPKIILPCSQDSLRCSIARLGSGSVDTQGFVG